MGCINSHEKVGSAFKNEVDSEGFYGCYQLDSRVGKFCRSTSLQILVLTHFSIYLFTDTEL